MVYPLLPQLEGSCSSPTMVVFYIIINPRCACAVRVTVVGLYMCVSVCLSVKIHLTFGASDCPEIDVTYSTSNKGQNICGVFSETTPLQRPSTPSIVRPYVQSAIFKAHVLTNEACQLAVGARVQRWHGRLSNNWQA